MYKIVSGRLELEKGRRFVVERAPLEAGKLYLFRKNSLLIVGRWFPGWIIQPHQWIDIENDPVTVLGRVEPV